jgi:hypothetical protein
MTAVHDGTNTVGCVSTETRNTTDLDREDTARILERGTARAILDRSLRTSENFTEIRSTSYSAIAIGRISKKTLTTIKQI